MCISIQSRSASLLEGHVLSPSYENGLRLNGVKVQPGQSNRLTPSHRHLRIDVIGRVTAKAHRARWWCGFVAARDGCPTTRSDAPYWSIMGCSWSAASNAPEFTPPSAKLSCHRPGPKTSSLRWRFRGAFRAIEPRPAAFCTQRLHYSPDYIAYTALSYTRPCHRFARHPHGYLSHNSGSVWIASPSLTDFHRLAPAGLSGDRCSMPAVASPVNASR
jgi:hypothetical protein